MLNGVSSDDLELPPDKHGGWLTNIMLLLLNYHSFSPASNLPPSVTIIAPFR